jgi:hypothetical protein
MTILEQATTFAIGDLVTTPIDGIGEIASPHYIDPIDGLESVVVRIDGNVAAYTVADIKHATVEDAWNLLQQVPSYVEVQAAAWSAELGLEVEA